MQNYCNNLFSYFELFPIIKSSLFLRSTRYSSICLEISISLSENKVSLYEFTEFVFNSMLDFGKFSDKLKCLSTLLDTPPAAILENIPASIFACSLSVNNPVTSEPAQPAASPIASFPNITAPERNVSSDTLLALDIGTNALAANANKPQTFS